MLVRPSAGIEIEPPQHRYDSVMGVVRSLFGCVVAACAACGCGATATDPSAPLGTAEAAPQVQSIVQGMKERYRSARTYGDEGTYRSVSRGANGKVVMTTTARVRTRWAAPDRLRFEWHEEPSDDDPGETIAVWTPRPGVTKSWFLGAEKDEPSLGDALGHLQGVSHGTTGLVPRWLYEHGCKFTLQYELRGKTSCGRATCFELAGSFGPDRRVTLFIDTANHALRRVVWHSTIPVEPIPEELLKDIDSERKERARRALEERRPVEDEDTLEIEPTFDRPLEATAFDFNPPTTARGVPKTPAP